MKTKNNLITGILIGICLVVLPLILMSGSNSPNENGNTFELTTIGGGSETVYMINKQTGETWYIRGKNSKVKHND
jgi:hypothetical protein